MVCLEGLHPEGQKTTIQLKGGRPCHESLKITSKAARSVKRLDDTVQTTVSIELRWRPEEWRRGGQSRVTGEMVHPDELPGIDTDLQQNCGFTSGTYGKSELGSINLMTPVISMQNHD